MPEPPLFPLPDLDIHIPSQKREQVAKLLQGESPQLAVLDHGDFRLRDAEECSGLDLRKLTVLDDLVYLAGDGAFRQQFLCVKQAQVGEHVTCGRSCNCLLDLFLSSLWLSHSSSSRKPYLSQACRKPIPT